ncbi:MAG: type IV pilus modification PilV family protein [Candidatus Methylomirabilia bacterium]
MITHLRRTDGFTLVESMIALFFLSFMVGEMAMVDVGAKRSAHLAKQITKANTYADEGMEKARNINYAKLFLANGNMNETCVPNPAPTDTTTTVTCTSIAPIEGTFTRRRIVTTLDAANAATPLDASGKADVVVTVTFTDARGAAQRVSVASVMTKF